MVHMCVIRPHSHDHKLPFIEVITTTKNKVSLSNCIAFFSHHLDSCYVSKIRIRYCHLTSDSQSEASTPL